MADFGGDDFLSWYYGGLPQPDPTVPAAPVDPLALTEYGLPSIGALPPPPPPPPPVQKLGNNPPVEETAAPVPAAQPAPVEPAPMQPGLGIPAAALEGAVAGAPSVAAPVRAAPTAPDLNPWGVVEPELPPDPWAPKPDAAPIGQALQALHPVGQAIELDEMSPERLGEVLGTADPVAYAGYKAAKIGEQQAEFANRRAKALADDTAWMERNAAARVQAKQRADQLAMQVDQEASQLSADGGYWRSLSTGQTIAAFVAVIAGGLGARATGGQNIGLQMINGHIDRAIAAQRAKLADRRNAVTQMYERLGSEYAGNEAIRAATWKQVEQRLLTEMQNYDPRSSRAMLIADQIQQARAQQAEAIGKARTAEEKRAMDLAEFQLRREKNAADVRKTLAEALGIERKNAGIGVGGGVGTAAEKQVFTPDQIGQMHPGAPPPPVPMTLSDYTKWLDRQGKGLNVAKVAGEGAKQQAEDERKLQVGGLTNKDGKPFLARNEQVAADLTGKVSAARQIVSIIDRIDAIRERVGGESSLFNSDAKQELEVLGNELVIIKKAGTQGMSSDEDMKRIEESLGASDVTSFRSKSAGLKAGRQRTLASINTVLSDNGYKGKPIDIKNLYQFGRDTTGENVIKQHQYEDDEHRKSGSPTVRDPDTGKILFTGDLPQKPAPAYTLEAERQRRAKVQRAMELSKQLGGTTFLTVDAQGRIVDPETGKVYE